MEGFYNDFEINPTINCDIELTQIQEHIGNHIEAFKRSIFADLNKLQKVCNAGLTSAEYDTVLAAIKINEEDICKKTRDLSNKMKGMVTKQS